MQKKWIRMVVGLVGWLLVLDGSACAQTGKTEKPNIVIILADDMGYGDVGFFNPNARTRTPAIDEMARNGLVFTDAHAGGAVCTPSRYGLLTGRYYFRVGRHTEHLGYLNPLIEHGRETIGSLLQRAGYTTACIGKWHLGLTWGLKDVNAPQIPEEGSARPETDVRTGKVGTTAGVAGRATDSAGVIARLRGKNFTNTDFAKNITNGPNALGFDYSFILPASLDMPPYVFIRNDKVKDPAIVLTADAYPRTLDRTLPVWDRKYTDQDDVYWERGIWWRNGEMSRSFRMEDCLDTIVGQGIGFIRDQVRERPGKPFLLYLALTGPHTPWLSDSAFKGRTALGAYGDFVLQVDDVVRQVKATLRTLKIADNTLVVFASDNGAPWAEDDIQTYSHESNWSRRGQKGDIWDGGHHIPLILQWPEKIKKYRVSTPTVSLIDLLATFSEMTGQPVKGNFGEDSFSFYDVLGAGGNTIKRRDQILYISSGGLLAIKQGDWKLIDGLGSGGFTEPSKLAPVKGGPRGQLYNVRRDPLESVNLYLQNPLKVKELKDLLEQLKQQGFSR